jgi:hypothetical protein
MGLDNGYGLGIGSLKPGVCTSSTRPASPYEGQMVYETDTDILAIWNGTAWRQLAAATKTGSVLQVVNATYSTQTSTTSGTGVATGLTATITPTSTSSKILVTVSQNGLYSGGGTVGMQVNLLKNGSQFAKLGGRIGGDSSNIVFSVGGLSAEILDSPATTSATTYSTSFFSENGSSIMYVQVYSSTSTITLTEIAG